MSPSALLLCGALALSGPLGDIPPQPSPTFASAQRPDAQRLQASAQKTTTIETCLVTLIREIDVPAPESGRLVLMNVLDGQGINENDVIAGIDDEQAQLSKSAAETERDAAITQANDDIEVVYAEAAYQVDDAELELNLGINRQRPGSIPAAEINRLRLARHRSMLQIQRSKLNQKVAKMNAQVQEQAVKSAEAAIRRRTITSPITGEVLTTFHEAGEWVKAGDPVARVVKMDRLRVEGFIDATLFDPADIDGRPVIVETELAGGRKESFAGYVTYISAVVQAGNRYRVRAEVNNRKQGKHWLLRAGASAKMTIALQ